MAQESRTCLMDSYSMMIPGRVVCSDKGYVVCQIERYYAFYEQDNPPRALLLRRDDYLPDGHPYDGAASSVLYLSRVTRWSNPESEPITDAEREMLKQRLTDTFVFMGDPAPLIS